MLHLNGKLAVILGLIIISSVISFSIATNVFAVANIKATNNNDTLSITHGTGMVVKSFVANKTLFLDTVRQSASYTTRTIDLSTAGKYTTTIDNDTADTAITATAEPASPQFVQTISGGNIPTDTTDVQDYTILLTVGGKNTNATTAKTISMIPTRNGVDIDTTRLIAVTNGNFWTSGYYLSGASLSAGDKIGLKMWCTSVPCSSGGGLDYRYGTLYIVPRQFISTNNGEYSILPGTTTTITFTGAIATVVYSLSTPLSFGGNIACTTIDPILGSMSSSSNAGICLTIKGQSLSELSSSAKVTTDAGFTPTQQAASNLGSLTLPKFVRINTLS